MLLVADRGNARLHIFTMDGKAHQFRRGHQSAMSLGERKGVFVIPDLGARVTRSTGTTTSSSILGDDSRVSGARLA